MLNIQDNVSLLQYNTFNIDVKAKSFIEINTLDDAVELINSNTDVSNVLIIGGGSNILFTKDFDGLVIHPNIKGFDILHEDDINVYIKVYAGVIWDDFVEYAVENKYGGIENLSHIPGCVGAAPVQNIGAYGAKVKNVIDSVSVVDLIDKTTLVYQNYECEFGYRSSIFKAHYKDRYLITDVTFKLNKIPDFNTSYGSIKAKLQEYDTISLSIIRKIICEIRESKLPDHKELGNAGSFFKNPIITAEHAENLLKNFPDIVTYKQTENTVKIAAGWLIESCGWKGKTIGNASVHKDQALVIVNNGNAQGSDIVALANNIRQSVYDKFGIRVESEVNII